MEGSLPCRYEQAVTTNRKDLKAEIPSDSVGKGTAAWLSPAAMYSVGPGGHQG